MSISSLSNTSSSSNVYFDTAPPRAKGTSFSQNNQTDTVSISLEATEKYLAMKNDAEKKAQSASSSESTQSTENMDTAAKVRAYWDAVSSSGTKNTARYSEWLPENIEKYETIMGELRDALENGTAGNDDAKYAVKLAMVFEAIGSNKVITDEDIAAGVAKINDNDIVTRLNHSLMPTSEAEWDSMEADMALAAKKLAEYKLSTQRIGQEMELFS